LTSVIEYYRPSVIRIIPQVLSSTYMILCAVFWNISLLSSNRYSMRRNTNGFLRVYLIRSTVSAWIVEPTLQWVVRINKYL
jgi:hypothetical protein